MYVFIYALMCSDGGVAKSTEPTRNRKIGIFFTETWNIRLRQLSQVHIAKLVTGLFYKQAGCQPNTRNVSL